MTKNIKTISFFILLVFSALILMVLSANKWENSPKMNGVSFVAPPRPIEATVMKSIERINVNWVAITPYAFSKANEPQVNHSHDGQWWGERPDGVEKTIEFAKNMGLKVMLKPHVWVRSQGWAGDYTLNSQEEWNIWFEDYKHYIITYAQIAEKMNVELLCIGTEYRKSVTSQPELWKQLITEVRKIYSGKITYAANWDNYKNVTFWDKLDYIGIDAYFPLSNEKLPEVEHLVKQWIPLKSEIEKFSNKWGKKVVFTEYGYESRDYAADGDWNYNKDTLNVNLLGQSNAYEGVFESFWKEKWFEGGFLWKWHPNDPDVGGTEDKEFTPQNKPVEKTINKYYNEGLVN